MSTVALAPQQEMFEAASTVAQEVQLTAVAEEAKAVKIAKANAMLGELKSRVSLSTRARKVGTAILAASMLTGALAPAAAATERAVTSTTPAESTTSTTPEGTTPSAAELESTDALSDAVDTYIDAYDNAEAEDAELTLSDTSSTEEEKTEAQKLIDSRDSALTDLSTAVDDGSTDEELLAAASEHVDLTGEAKKAIEKADDTQDDIDQETATKAKEEADISYTALVDASDGSSSASEEDAATEDSGSEDSAADTGSEAADSAASTADQVEELKKQIGEITDSIDTIGDNPTKEDVDKLKSDIEEIKKKLDGVTSADTGSEAADSSSTEDSEDSDFNAAKYKNEFNSNEALGLVGKFDINPNAPKQSLENFFNELRHNPRAQAFWNTCLLNGGTYEACVEKPGVLKEAKERYHKYASMPLERKAELAEALIKRFEKDYTYGGVVEHNGAYNTVAATKGGGFAPDTNVRNNDPWLQFVNKKTGKATYVRECDQIVEYVPTPKAVPGSTIKFTPRGTVVIPPPYNPPTGNISNPTPNRPTGSVVVPGPKTKKKTPVPTDHQTVAGAPGSGGHAEGSPEDAPTVAPVLEEPAGNPPATAPVTPVEVTPVKEVAVEPITEAPATTGGAAEPTS